MTLPDSAHQPESTRPPIGLAAGGGSTLAAPALTLLPHPADTGAGPTPDIAITARWAVAGSEDGPGLLLRFALCGDLGGLRLPAPAAPGPADGLWRHTCLEAFLAVQGEAAYREFNFSPSGQWATYRFRGERERDTEAEAAATAAAPEMAWRFPTRQAGGMAGGPSSTVAPDTASARAGHTAEHALTLLAWLPMALLPRPLPGHAWLMGLTAVLETTDGRLSHWALHHPVPRPDFHHRGGWLPQPGLPGLLAATRPAPTPSP